MVSTNSTEKTLVCHEGGCGRMFECWESLTAHEEKAHAVAVPGVQVDDTVAEITKGAESLDVNKEESLAVKPASTLSEKPTDAGAPQTSISANSSSASRSMTEKTGTSIYTTSPIPRSNPADRYIPSPNFEVKPTIHYFKSLPKDQGPRNIEFGFMDTTANEMLDASSCSDGDSNYSGC